MHEEKVTGTARDEEEIVERGLIAYCVVFFSEHVLLDIVMTEKLKQKG
jgi:hypothetical protein